MPQDEYDNKIGIIDAKLDLLHLYRKQGFHPTREPASRKVKGIHKTTLVTLAAKVKIYNILTKSFEMEKLIFMSNGDPLSYISPDLTGLLNVDKNRAIYLRLYQHKENKYLHYIIKLDKNLNTEWEYHIPSPFSFSKIVNNGNIYFGFRSHGEYYLIDKNLQRFSNQQAHSAGLIPEHVSLEKIVRKGLYNIEAELEVNEEKNTIKFLNNREN